MTKDDQAAKYANTPRSQVRRTDYEVKDEQWIKGLLALCELLLVQVCVQVRYGIV